MLSITIDGADEFMLDLTRFSDRATNLTSIGNGSDIAKSFDRQFVSIEKRLFQSEGRTGEHGMWPEIRPETIRRKIRKGQDTRILHATHELEDSLTRMTDKNHVRRITKDEIFLGTKDPKAVFHQRARNGRLKRRVIDVTGRQRRTFAKILQRYIVEGDGG